MADHGQMPPRQNDELLKGVIEDNFPDFLRFLYPDADGIFDLEKKIEFMDKELKKITSDRGEQKGGRRADLLAKVHLRDGTEKWILVHTEIEGGRGEDFPFRMFQYYYRILDEKQPRPSAYSRQAINTGLRFWYHTYHVLTYSEEHLLAMDNVFGLVTIACQKALHEGKIPDEDLGRVRMAIARELFRRNYDSERITSLLHFLKNFLYVRDPEINRIFDDEVAQFSGGTTKMGVIEVLKEQAKRQGLEIGTAMGMEKGRLEGRLEGLQIAAREMKTARFPIDQIVRFTKLSAEEIKKL